MPPDRRTMEIVVAFQRFVRSSDQTEIAGLTIDELRNADHQLGWRDAQDGYRLALRDRIAELERAAADEADEAERVAVRAVQVADREDDRARESYARVRNWIVTFCIAVIASYLIYRLTRA